MNRKAYKINLVISVILFLVITTIIVTNSGLDIATKLGLM